MRFKIFCQSMHGSLLLLHSFVICVMSQISKFCFVFFNFFYFIIVCLLKNPRRPTSLMNRQEGLNFCLILRCYFITEYYNCFRLRAFPYRKRRLYTISIAVSYTFCLIDKCFIITSCICPGSIGHPAISAFQL